MAASKRTKIVCTIGPASSSEDVIRSLLKEGMNVARLNFSHGTREEHAEILARLRAVATELDQPLAIMQDLQGPKIRVGELPEEGVKLNPGMRVIFTTGELSVKDMRLPVTYDKLPSDVKAGERILLDDGLLSVKVTAVEGSDVVCEVVDGGVLLSHKGMNLPETSLTVSAMSEKDRDDMKFGVEQRVDWVALSFVRSAKEVYDLRYLIKELEDKLESEDVHHGVPIRVIAKIEKSEAVKNIDEIVEAADGIMVARGDLGIEMPAEDVPLIQKRLIDKCLAAAKPVIVATQMLDSMIRNPRPTRAEVSDIANAVIDHTDAIMLSGETASGKYPVEAVRTMTEVVKETEASGYDDLPVNMSLTAKSVNEAVSEVANILSREVKARLILVATLSGNAARIVSRYRPNLPIAATTSDERVFRQLSLSWGVIPFLVPPCGTVEELADRSIGYLKKKSLVKKGDHIVIVAGEPVGSTGGVNLVEIKDVT